MDWTDRYPNRFEKEKAVVRDRFSGTNPKLKEYDGRLAWVLNITKDSGTTYKVVVAYPDNYPLEEPRAFIGDPKIRPSETKHMFNSGSLCLFSREDRAWKENSTAATVIAWAATWLTAYENWQRTGNWPGDEKKH